MWYRTRCLKGWLLEVSVPGHNVIGGGAFTLSQIKQWAVEVHLLFFEVVTSNIHANNQHTYINHNNSCNYHPWTFFASLIFVFVGIRILCLHGNVGCKNFPFEATCKILFSPPSLKNSSLRVTSFKFPHLIFKCTLALSKRQLRIRAVDASFSNEIRDYRTIVCSDISSRDTILELMSITLESTVSPKAQEISRVALPLLLDAKFFATEDVIQ
jgi:hypothetical protein